MVSISVLVSVAGGVAATLISVFVGSLVGFRSQTRQWFRDKQVQACADILRESTKILLEYERASRKHEKQQVDWVPWNESLALISIVAEDPIVEAAICIDKCFWNTTPCIDSLKVSDEEWFAIRDDIESQRLAFINTTRRVLGRTGPPLRHILGRPGVWPTDTPKNELAAEQSTEHPRRRHTPTDI